MIGVLARHDDRAFGLILPGPVGPHQPDVGVVRVRSGIAEENAVQVPGCELGQLLRQRDGGHVRGLEEGVVIGQLAHLPGGGIGQFVAPVADVDAPQPGHAVEDLVAVAVGEKHALGPRDDPSALRRDLLVGGEGVHVVSRVDRLQFGSGKVVRDLVHRTVLSGLRLAYGQNMIKLFGVNRIAHIENEFHPLGDILPHGVRRRIGIASAKGTEDLGMPVG